VFNGTYDQLVQTEFFSLIKNKLDSSHIKPTGKEEEEEKIKDEIDDEIRSTFSEKSFISEKGTEII
jgi:hypothetical protein